VVSVSHLMQLGILEHLIDRPVHALRHAARFAPLQIGAAFA
jgi:hypothetical protein